jgi:hypothetical protein
MRVRSPRKLVLGLVLLISGGTGLGVAFAFAPNDEPPGVLYRYVRGGVTVTGEVATVTENGVVRRVIRWRTREGKTKTQTITGPLRIRTTSGGTAYIAGPTTTLPGQTKTTTLQHTVTATQTQTVVDVVTVVETLPAETVTIVETVTEPPPQP